ncbi:response regulator [Synechococcus sp. W60.1]|uniref:response regulator transcription factor n=1 Tax=Synechococcus sp. W60.1 TaxID=2964516 RepID=UPI0039C05760
MSTLLAEDDALYRQHVHSLLTQHLPEFGPVYMASNGREALELYRQHHPNFVLMDIRMPEMAGIEVARQVWSECPSTRIIFWSHFPMKSMCRNCTRSCLRKPSMATF